MFYTLQPRSRNCYSTACMSCHMHDFEVFVLTVCLRLIWLKYSTLPIQKQNPISYICLAILVYNRFASWILPLDIIPSHGQERAACECVLTSCLISCIIKQTTQYVHIAEVVPNYIDSQHTEFGEQLIHSFCELLMCRMHITKYAEESPC